MFVTTIKLKFVISEAQLLINKYLIENISSSTNRDIGMLEMGLFIVQVSPVIIIYFI